MMRSFQYKARLSPSMKRNAAGQLRLCAELYNAALQERRDHWKIKGQSISWYDQNVQLKDIKVERPEFAAIDSQVLESVLRRLDLAFKAFFRRVKAGLTPGYPRFRAAARYDSISFRQSGWKLVGNRLTLRGIGTLRLHLSRPIQGTVKRVTVRRDRCGDWFITFACQDVPTNLLPDTGRAIGIDLGLKAFLVTSEGETVENPRHLQHTAAKLRRGHRRVARRTKGGTRRRKAGTLLARAYRTLERTRRDFHFKTALDLVRQFDLIAVEDLNVSGLARGRLAKSVGDAGWGQFLAILSSKAESAGRQLIAVDPRGTSQACSGCGATVRKTLAQRVHSCACGLVMDRDWNAARNILARAEPSGSDQGCKRVA